MPATIVSDSTSERLEAAKRLIAENRSRSIASLTSMLDRIYQARASDEIARRAKDAEPEQDTILKAAVERLENAFNIYAGRREPLLTRLSATARSVALEPVPIPMSSSPSATIRIKEANDLRSQIRALDSGFDTEAAQILTDAQKEIQTETAALRNQASKTQADARDQAMAEAESQANATQVSLNVQVTKLLPENLPAVAGRTVTIAGSGKLASAPVEKIQPIFGSLEERKRLLDREIDIWVRTTGRNRSLTSKGAHDRTEEFLQWRSAHKVGP